MCVPVKEIYLTSASTAPDPALDLKYHLFCNTVTAFFVRIFTRQVCVHVIGCSYALVARFWITSSMLTCDVNFRVCGADDDGVSDVPSHWGKKSWSGKSQGLSAALLFFVEHDDMTVCKANTRASHPPVERGNWHLHQVCPVLFYYYLKYSFYIFSSY